MANNRKFSVAQATHNYARRLPAVGLKLRLFFPIKVNPLNLESQNQFKNMSVILPSSSPIKIGQGVHL